MTNIEWTDATWNPVRGCSRVSRGCENCYAERQAMRHAGPGRPYKGLVRVVNGHPTWTGEVRLVPERLEEPLRWRKPRRVFVNSMSDMFHEAVAPRVLSSVWAVMRRTPRHQYQILTKRPGRMLRWSKSWSAATNPPTSHGDDETKPCGHGHWSRTGETRAPLPNVWLGVSVEDQATADERIPLLLDTPAAVRFVSYEPALGPVDFGPWLSTDTPDACCPVCGEIACHHGALDWIIVGGESGPGARSCDVVWIRSAVEAAKAAGVPCFVKQLGARPILGPHRGHVVEQSPESLAVHGHYDPEPWEMSLRDRKGGDPAEWPEDLRVREWPRVSGEVGR